MRRVSNTLFFLTLGSMLFTIAVPPSAEAHMPGPSQHLFDSPYYACGRNYYISLSGSDTNSGTSPSSPWLTLQHANDVGRSAGDCVNVAPGTYTHGVLINSGGNLASKTGYVVYRCEAMDQCIITATSENSQNGSFAWNTAQPMGGSYVIIDGFTMRAASETEYGQGVNVWDGNETGRAPNSVHHIWVLNSIISGYGQSGITMNDGEYFYVVHNTIYGNANVGCSAQGSGISYAVLKAFANYTRTPDDAGNKMVGNIGAFNNAMEYNITYNNATTGCGTGNNPYDTDGNNIIVDTTSNAGSTNIPYPGSILIAFNLSYNAGGRGIHIFRSSNVTVANNSCFNSALDPADNGTYRPCIGDLNSSNDVFINNIAYAIAGTGYLAYNQAFNAGSVTDVLINNISYCSGNPLYGCTPMFGGALFSCITNQCMVEPSWTNVGASSPGTETQQPIIANFALASGSPAIGKGLLEPYLPPQSIDIGACPSSATICPRPGLQP